MLLSFVFLRKVSLVISIIQCSDSSRGLCVVVLLFVIRELFCYMYRASSFGLILSLSLSLVFILSLVLTLTIQVLILLV